MTESALMWMYFPTALLLGALHALEPGHAKSLTAAYLIGIKGTKLDAFLLGLSVATTHSFVVIAISVSALWFGREAFTQDVTHWLQIGSGLVVIALGFWMLMRRLGQMHRSSAAFRFANSRFFADSSGSVSFVKTELAAHQDHSLMTDDEHARAHAATIPKYARSGERPTLVQIVVFGAAGGMIPCPASITVMLLALSIGQFGSGLLAVAGFSLGLAITLVGIGLTVVAGLSRLQSSGRFAWVSVKAPVLSAAVVMLSGVAALVFAGH